VTPASAPAGRAQSELTDDGSRAALRSATEAALAVLANRAARPDATTETTRAARGLVLLREALQEPAGSFAAALGARFPPAAAREVFVTGYHEPTLRARRTRDARFRHPIHRLPEGRAALPARAEIDAGALAGRGLELFWTDDAVELFFLHVQGSGRLELEDGTVVRIGYAGNNGKTYRAIGSVLVERGALRREEVTAPAIKAWLRAHPAAAPGIMHANPRYVFFQVRTGRAGDGPPGALGAPLVPYRSVAVDPKVVPLGSIGHLRVALPGSDTFSAVVVAMDTGTAITGPGRIDLFCGADDEAARIAGELRHTGELIWLAPAR
jgi:membrane-bound lytic murein transglycosylase A